jgi:hypothetical protein
MPRSSYDYNFLGMKTITKVEECTVIKWTYRFTTNEKGVTVNRVPADNPLWSHGFYNDAYCIEEKKWIAMANSGFPEYFTDLGRAIEAVTRDKSFYDGINDEVVVEDDE